MSYYCAECDKWWSYTVNKCIFCGNETQKIIHDNYVVIGSTLINVPTRGNEKVPYFNYLLESEKGNKIIIKSFKEYEIGDNINFNNDETDLDKYKVGIIGTGQMGLGIAEYVLTQGHEIILKTRKNSDNIHQGIRGKLSKYFSEDLVSDFMNNLIITESYSSLKDCDLVIEAIPENIVLKKAVFEEISQICDEKTIFATNTSSLSISEIAEVTDRSDKVIGMHFFNPVSRMDLIEVVIGDKTSQNTQDWITGFSYDLNKTPIMVKDSPGFIVNRLLFLQINEAIKLYENKVASKEDIDNAIKLGLNHPMGPFKLADFVGIDICASILETLYEKFKSEKFKPASTLIELLNDGKLGLKSGEGFYKY